MEPNRGRGSLEGRHALRQQAGGDPRQHVACPCGGQERRRIGIDGGAAVGAGNNGVGTLEHDDRAAKLAPPNGLAQVLIQL